MGWFGPQSGDCSCCGDGGNNCCPDGSPVTSPSLITFVIEEDPTCPNDFIFICSDVIGTYQFSINSVCTMEAGTTVSVALGEEECQPDDYLLFTLDFVNDSVAIQYVSPGTGGAPPTGVIALDDTTTNLCSGTVDNCAGGFRFSASLS